jgi:small subunit ribosomal protein S6
LRDYELVLILSPEISGDDLSVTLEKVDKFISERGGTVIEVNQWGTRKLAYPIKHFMEGHYVLTRFKFEPKLAMEFEANLQRWEEVLRHLLVRVGD